MGVEHVDCIEVYKQEGVEHLRFLKVDIGLKNEALKADDCGVLVAGAHFVFLVLFLVGFGKATEVFPWEAAESAWGDADASAVVEDVVVGKEDVFVVVHYDAVVEREAAIVGVNYDAVVVG